MKTVFWAFFFIFLDFNLGINGHDLNIIPDFAGYILLCRAADGLGGENRRFGQLRPFAMGMAVYTGILWVGDLLAVTGGSWLDSLLGLIALAVSLFISWNVVQAVREMEEAREADLNGQSLRTAWFVLLAAQIAGRVSALLISPMGVVLTIIAGLVGIVWFLAALWKCARLYGELPPALER